MPYPDNQLRHQSAVCSSKNNNQEDAMDSTSLINFSFDEKTLRIIAPEKPTNGGRKSTSPLDWSYILPRYIILALKPSTYSTNQRAMYCSSCSEQECSRMGKDQEQ
jgi:hypothetical protein